MNKQETVLVVISICMFTVLSFIAGRTYECISMIGMISREAEKHKQRFFDEGYEASKAEMTGILVGNGLTRDYANYSDPCMLAQGASYNTDPNIMWSLVVSDPNLIEINNPYGKGFNDALDAITLLNLEISLGTERKTFGEMADICRERFGVAK